MKVHFGDFVVTDERESLDLDFVHRFLATESYWAEAIPREVLERAIANSLCFCVHRGDRQVAFARVITDYATFGYLADVFVDQSERGRGASRALMSFIMSHPQLQGLRRWMLVTRDAHGLYKKFGFHTLNAPERFMEITRPGMYKKA